MNSVTVVTAYFNIGRGGFKARPRTEKQYLHQFEFWARMRNRLVVYTESTAVPEILAIRRKFGLEQMTEFVVVDDLFELEPDIYRTMLEISHERYFRDFRIMPDATSGIAAYSYLMLLKTWFVADAVRRGLTGETVAWLDFGFNHGGSVYMSPEEFDFEWRSECPEFVLLFLERDYDTRPIFEIVRRLSDCVMGPVIVIPASRAQELWESNRDAMITLNRVGMIDDDQLVQLLSYRMKPGLFELRRSGWFLPLKELAAPHLSVHAVPPRSFPLETVRRVIHSVRRRKLALATSFRLYRNLLRDRV